MPTTLPPTTPTPIALTPTTLLPTTPMPIPSTNNNTISYRPSFIPSATSIISMPAQITNESVDESTVETPITGENSMTPLILVSILFLFSIFVVKIKFGK